MSLIKNRGSAAKEDLFDLQKAMIKLKDGEFVRVRILGIEDYVDYDAHEEFSLSIYPQPCTLPLGWRCAYDEVMDIVRGLPGGHELKKFGKLYKKTRFIFAFADLDSGLIRYLDVTQNQAAKLLQSIEEYASHIGDTAFNLKRTGASQDTSYTVTPILKMDSALKEKFAKFDGEEVDPSSFEKTLRPQKFEMQLNYLRKAGFPVEQYFEGADGIGESEQEPLNVNEDDLPF
jgi:hypothetical protein